MAARAWRHPACLACAVACLAFVVLAASCQRASGSEGPSAPGSPLGGQSAPPIQPTPPAQPVPPESPAGQGFPVSPARLLRGPLAVHGLPFFGPNALPALRGEYGLGQVVLPVWSCRERLVFGAAWTAVAADSRPGLKVWRRDGAPGPVLAYVSPAYTLFFELPTEAPAFHRFALAMESRFQVFFESAGSDAELSFPAFVNFLP